MVQLADLFSVPEMSLLCNVTEYFLQNHIDYHPEILFRDVKVNYFDVANVILLIVYTIHFIQYLEFCAKLPSYNASTSGGKCVRLSRTE